MTEVEKEMYNAVHNGDVLTVRRLFENSPDLISLNVAGDTLLHIAVKYSKSIEMTRILTDAGIDINTPMSDSPTRPLHDAAGKGLIEIAIWLLDHGADVDGCITDGATPLIDAIIKGNLDMVKLLVERGANMNVKYSSPPIDVVQAAEMWGHSEIVDYLKSKSAKKTVRHQTEDEILEHIRKYLGPVKELALTEIVGYLQIHIVPPTIERDYITLVTNGMSTQPMIVPKGYEDYRFIELLIHLPKDWPLTLEAFRDKKVYWPIEWLRRIAYYPLENNKWICSEDVISNGEPAMPFAEGTKLSCFLVLEEPTDLGQFQTKDGRLIRFYELFPLYVEERELFQSKGLEYLLKLFQRHRIEMAVNPKRINVAEVK